MKILAMMVGLLSVVGCSSGPAAQPEKKLTMRNPASVYCIEQGGKLEIVNTGNGQLGYCTLPGGEHIEEWQLYRRDHNQN